MELKAMVAVCNSSSRMGATAPQPALSLAEGPPTRPQPRWRLPVPSTMLVGVCPPYNQVAFSVYTGVCHHPATPSNLRTQLLVSSLSSLLPHLCSPTPAFGQASSWALGKGLMAFPVAGLMGLDSTHCPHLLMQSGGQVGLQDGDRWLVHEGSWPGTEMQVAPTTETLIQAMCYGLSINPKPLQSPGCPTSHAILLERGLRTAGIWIPHHSSTQCKALMQAPPRPVCWTSGKATLGASPCCAHNGGHQPRQPGLPPVLLFLPHTPVCIPPQEGQSRAQV
ncbi:hypothetical protein AAY473_004048 [Plecturocebus cupreus]